ncbi:MAG TPA: alkaline phosphatase family protein [Marmoricola sp.]|nr:alkaline phosphatase family protein [Marmoricola sp.]
MRRTRKLVAALAAAALSTLAIQGTTEAAPDQARGPAAKPQRVLIIVVDALSKEIVKKYGMTNVQSLMRDQVDSPKSYLGHVGSVTVVTHNVLTSGLLPKHMGWTDDGYRDVDNVLGTPGGLWIPSDWTKDQMFAVQQHIGKPKLADYLHTGRPGSKVFTVSPKRYAAWAYGGPTSDTIVTFGGSKTCPDGLKYRVVDGVNVPSYLSEDCGRYFVPRLSAGAYDTGGLPASLYSVGDDRYVVGKNAAHAGGDVWAADAAIDIMRHEDNWSGLFVTLPGVDKAAHMWGGVTDPGGADPMTHMEFAASTADQQVGRLIAELKSQDKWKDTLVVLTADHGSVAGKHFHGDTSAELDYGYYNWYYGTAQNGSYLKPQAALKPLTDTGNVGLSYSDSMLRAWLTDQSPAKVAEAAKIMATLPDVSAVWVRDGDHYNRASKIKWRKMRRGAEKSWFARHARELVNTEAAPYGPDVIATLVEDTTYSIAGDHGGIQRQSQQIPIVFAGSGLGRKDLQAKIRSVDIMPTILRAMQIPITSSMDGVAYRLP